MAETHPVTLSWKGSAARTRLAELLKVRYLYVYPGLLYFPNSPWIESRSDIGANERMSADA